MSDADELVDGTVLSLARVTDQFPKDSPKPLADLFRPTSTEKAIAQATGSPILRSVFDRERTTVAQARSIRRTESDTVPFGLPVDGIRSVAIPGTTRNLRVLRDLFDQIVLPENPSLDPLRSELETVAAMPGADGHCGIEGLGDDICARSRDRKNLRAALRHIAFRIADEQPP